MNKIINILSLILITLFLHVSPMDNSLNTRYNLRDRKDKNNKDIKKNEKSKKALDAPKKAGYTGCQTNKVALNQNDVFPLCDNSTTTPTTCEIKASQTPEMSLIAGTIVFAETLREFISPQEQTTPGQELPIPIHHFLTRDYLLDTISRLQGSFAVLLAIQKEKDTVNKEIVTNANDNIIDEQIVDYATCINNLSTLSNDIDKNYSVDDDQEITNTLTIVENYNETLKTIIYNSLPVSIPTNKRKYNLTNEDDQRGFKKIKSLDSYFFSNR
ncbi:MAG TPA: hypothetical protein VLB80_04285 [Candidatus Babeliales bacterium]|nr:hypothetical protein [Candidatus Babeliales bacterium]